MSMDAARARFPECPQCGIGVDENDPDNAYYIVDGDHYHAKCLDEEIPLCERCGMRGWPGDIRDPCLCCEGCEGRGELSVHGLSGQWCGACNGTGRADGRDPQEEDVAMDTIPGTDIWVREDGLPVVDLP